MTTRGYREWCRDSFGGYATSPRPGDGLRHEPVDDSYRVVRGGGWDDAADYTRSAFRSRFLPGFRGNDIGFRPVQGIR